MRVYAINILGRITSDRKTHDTAMVRSYSNTYLMYCSAVWCEYKISTPAPSPFDLTGGSGTPSTKARMHRSINSACRFADALEETRLPLIGFNRSVVLEDIALPLLNEISRMAQGDNFWSELSERCGN